ncbi:phosphocholine cytidylyltransferase family protein [Clostridium swellfunianum]|uniref:phosphocholine cytidylyltransferase family protein n=1 Tax=Clostridium swellfunianum TaxID=1367462 RepID=UPI002030CCFE|nr:phosphocholine cytidylyltransferase family protein [Clostridium swellfunianum]MCM0650589.1 phosphocholine cytidylyltransferase family protein [Clostridium swellfunianum]
MVTTAVILAAGLGSRLKEKTKYMPKGFLTIEDKAIVLRSIDKLIEAGINRLVIGTGYHSEYYEELALKNPLIECVKNEEFASTGSMYTLYNLQSKINEDFLLLESDILYDKHGLDELLKDRRANVILASGKTNSNDEVYIEADKDNKLVNMSKKSEQLQSIYAELVGITKVSNDMYKEMCRYTANELEKNRKFDYESVIVAVSKKMDVYVNKLEDYAWCEIDDDTHLNRALNSIFPKIKESEENGKH